MIHWLLHVTGIDTQASPFYDFWSGIGTQFRFDWIILLALWYRHNNCHVHRCLRTGHAHPETNHLPVCRKHLPKGKQ